ncbi:ankyrin repeat protein [Lactarius psammicola]|nr:ankyrin repeat protein [Lactarius psammicola]
MATFNGCVDVSRMLLEHNADVNSPDNRGKVPLHRVSERSLDNLKRDDPGVVRLLLEHGADVDAEDEEYVTPLYLASSRGKAEVVRLLLDHGANADAEDMRGRAPSQGAIVAYTTNSGDLRRSTMVVLFIFV